MQVPPYLMLTNMTKLATMGQGYLIEKNYKKAWDCLLGAQGCADQLIAELRNVRQQISNVAKSIEDEINNG